MPNLSQEQINQYKEDGYIAPINKSLIKKRETIQKKIDDWLKKNEGKDFNKEKYINFLKLSACHKC